MDILLSIVSRNTHLFYPPISRGQNRPKLEDKLVVARNFRQTTPSRATTHNPYIYSSGSFE
jgi:hypothetical protein